MENISTRMKTYKILRINEFVDVCSKLPHNIRLYELHSENITTNPTHPLYESECMPSLSHKGESAIIVLPECEVSIESLTDTIAQFIDGQQIQGDVGFSVGNYLFGDYESEECKWSEKSLCVSLCGAISDRAGTIAVAVQIMAQFDLPKMLIINESSIMELTKEGKQSQLPKNRIRRLGE